MDFKNGQTRDHHLRRTPARAHPRFPFHSIGGWNAPWGFAGHREVVASQPSNGDEFIWLHFDLLDASAQSWMETHLAWAPEFFGALQQGSRSTRMEDAQDNLIAVVNDVAYDFSFDSSEIATLWTGISQRVAVRARPRPLRSIDRQLEAVKQDKRLLACPQDAMDASFVGDSIMAWLTYLNGAV